MSTSPFDKSKLATLLAKARAAKEQGIQFSKVPPIAPPVPITDISSVNEAIKSLESSQGIDRSTGLTIQYNAQQQEFVSLMSSGASCVLIGAAGSGKTTCQRGGISALISSGRAGKLEVTDHKHLRSNTPGIVVVSFTRRAVSNIRKAVSDDMKANCLTIHALLEYEPVYSEIWDEASGTYKNTMRFEATRNSHNPLPSSINTVIIEEGSMVSLELYEEIKNALPHSVQFIFLGDIQQLPPVFGSAILGYKMLELPVIELTTIYRQALESPIIRLAHRILSGKAIPLEEYEEWKYPNQLTLHPWKKRISPDTATITIAKFLTVAITHNVYNPDEDMVLIPFNKACGTIELNKHIAQFMARSRKSLVYEIISGFTKLYLSVGDKVLYDKEDAVVVDIIPNPDYVGASPQPAHELLDYWGYNEGTGGDSKHHVDEEGNSVADDIDFLLSQTVGGGGDNEEKKRQASHIVKVLVLETNSVIEIKSAGDMNALLLSFVLTVHKSQGSEFRKVFLMLHQSHATMLSRELLYTAVTRAKEELYVICEPESFTNGIKSQRIKGNTLAEKAEFFKGKVAENRGIGK